MKNKLILLALCLLTPALLRAEKHGQETPLSKQMEAMSKNFRQLGRQVSTDSKRDSSLQLIQAIQKNAETAKTLIPAKAKTVPAAEQAKFIEAYKKDIDVLLGQIAKLTDAIRAGKTDDANKILVGFRAIKTEGHEEFASEE